MQTSAQVTDFQVVILCLQVMQYPIQDVQVSGRASLTTYQQEITLPIWLPLFPLMWLLWTDLHIFISRASDQEATIHWLDAY